MVALDHLSQGFAVFDREQKLVVCNKPYAEMYELPPELTATGATMRAILEYRAARGIHFGSDGQAYIDHVAAIAASNQISTDEFTLWDGRVIRVLFRPLPDGGWVATHEDVTAPRRAEQQAQEEIQAQNLRLDAAITNMSHGLAMFDRDGTLIICNKQYAEAYNLPADLFRPGMSLKEILQIRIEHGAYAGDDPQVYVDYILGVVAANVQRVQAC